MGVLLLFLLFISPLVQIYYVNKRLKNKIRHSILVITILTMLSTVLLSIVGLTLYEISITNSTEVIKCDMIVPAVISINMLLVLIVIPAIGLLGGLKWNHKKRTIDLAIIHNPYKGTLKDSYIQNTK